MSRLNICRHNLLRRSCETCDLEQENKEYHETLMKIKEAYESEDENKLDELLHRLFTNEIYNDSY